MAGENTAQENMTTQEKRTSEMVEREIYAYMLSSLRAGYSTNIILDKLLRAGHDNDYIRAMLQKALGDRIKEINMISTNIPPLNYQTDFPKELLIKKYGYRAFSIFLSAVVKIVIFVVFIYTMSHVLINKIYFG